MPHLPRRAALSLLDTQLASLELTRRALELLRSHVAAGLMRMHADGSWEWTEAGERRFEETARRQ